MTPPISLDALRALPGTRNNDFVAARSLEITLKDGDCPERIGDILRPICRQTCTGRWRHVNRGKPGSVKFEFEDPTDATVFSLSV